MSENFPAVASNIKDAKTQAKTIKLYAQYRAMFTNMSMASGETGGVTAYDTCYLGKNSCVASAAVQTMCADMLGIDSCTYASKDHEASILRINGVYFDGESEGSYSSLADATRWASGGQMREWTSASVPTK